MLSRLQMDFHWDEFPDFMTLELLGSRLEVNYRVSTMRRTLLRRRNLCFRNRLIIRVGSNGAADRARPSFRLKRLLGVRGLRTGLRREQETLTSTARPAQTAGYIARNCWNCEKTGHCARVWRRVDVRTVSAAGRRTWPYAFHLFGKRRRESSSGRNGSCEIERCPRGIGRGDPWVSRHHVPRIRVTSVTVFSHLHRRAFREHWPALVDFESSWTLFGDRVIEIVERAYRLTTLRISVFVPRTNSENSREDWITIAIEGRVLRNYYLSIPEVSCSLYRGDRFFVRIDFFRVSLDFAFSEWHFVSY